MVGRIGRLTAVMLLAAVTLLMGGCGQEAKTDKVEVRWSIWAVPETEWVYRDMVKAFEAENSDIRIKLEIDPWANYPRKLLTMVAGASAPDVFTTEYSLLYPFISKGQVLSLDKYMAADKTFAVGDYFPQALAACKGMNGSFYALPKEINVLCLYYNKNLFDEAGIKYPADGWTWKDFLQNAKAISALKSGRGKNFGFYVSCRSTGYLPWIWQNDADIFDNSIKPARTTFDSPAVQESLQFMVDMLRKYHIAPNQSEEEGLGDIFATGRLGMMSAWMTAITQYEDTVKDFQWDIAPLPANKKKASRGLVLMYAIAANTKHPAEAFRFLRFLSGEKAQRILAKSGMAVPVLRKVAKSQDFLGEGERAAMMSRIVASVDYSIFDFGPARSLDNMQEISSAIDRNLERAFLGMASVKDACAKAKAEADKLIAEERSRKK